MQRFLSLCAALVALVVVAQARPVIAAEASTDALPPCDITGVVSSVQLVERSPWADGTPSTLSTTQTEISVVVKSRAPHYTNSQAKDLCTASSAQKITYKLCSPTKVKQGDYIRATESSATKSGSSSCLFDLVVVGSSG